MKQSGDYYLNRYLGTVSRARIAICQRVDGEPPSLVHHSALDRAVSNSNACTIFITKIQDNKSIEHALRF